MFGPASSEEGSDDDLGVIPRIIHHVYAYNRFKSCKLSFMEIYCEELYDLVESPFGQGEGGGGNGGGKKIQIREKADGEIVVPQLSQHQCETVADAMLLIKNGVAQRATTATSAQLHSSRSHAILQLAVHTCDDKLIKISLVDLAGSERLKKTKLETGGSGFLEAIKINSGLLALANVIRSLASTSTATSASTTSVRSMPQTLVSHIPYRQSKLTRFLKDGLGGDSLTVMIACISPNKIDFPESVNTAAYAARARNIRNRPVAHSFLRKVDYDVETLFGGDDDGEDEDYYHEDFEEDAVNSSSAGVDGSSIRELVRAAKQSKSEPEWLEKYLPVLRTKTLQLTNANNECEKLKQQIQELLQTNQSPNDNPTENDDQEDVMLRNQADEDEKESAVAVSSKVAGDKIDNNNDLNFMEFLQLKRQVREQEEALNRMYVERVDLDAQIQQIHEAYQIRIEAIQSDYNEQLAQMRSQFEKDNFYYRQANRELKEKLKAFMSMQEALNDQLKKNRDRKAVQP